MKNRFVTSLYLLIGLLILNACSSANTMNNELFKYRGSYVGDNSADLNIIKQLPKKENFQKLTLYTKNEPYGMNLKYDEIKGSNKEETVKKTVITNATYLFALIKNADWVTFDINGQRKYKVTRYKLENWYGKRLKEFTNQQDLNNLIQTHLDDTKQVNKFFK